MSEYKFISKRAGKLTSEEKKEIYNLNIKEYPKFKKYYQKNIYYSSIKPQKVLIIKLRDKIIGTGKLLWRKIRLYNQNIKMAAFGVLIDRNYHRKGLGTKLIKIQIKEAKRVKADFIYCSTSNPIAKKILLKLGFMKINSPIFYKEIFSKKIKKVKIQSYILELDKDVLKVISNEKGLFLGLGPL